MGRILILNQNYNSSRKVFQNAPNGIRACLDFQNFPGVGFPRTLHLKWPPDHFNTPGVISRTPNADFRAQNANQNHRSKQKPTGVYLVVRLA